MNTYIKFFSVIDTIENHLCDEIDIGRLSGEFQTSVYEFRRIFACLAGIPVGEYIRKRRLSKAGEELLSGSLSVTQAALKYGYDSPSSFSRAFKQFHGISPSELNKSANKLHTFTRINIQIESTGGNDIVYTVVSDGAFSLDGVSSFSALSDTECCEDAWNAFYCSEKSKTCAASADGKIYALYENSDTGVNCTIGRRVSCDSGHYTVPESKWVCFTVNTTKDAEVNAFYEKIRQWFDSSGYTRNRLIPNLEIYPTDMEEDGFEWEIRIPITG